VLVKNNINKYTTGDINYDFEIPNNLKIAYCNLKERVLKLDEIKKNQKNISESTA
jgi:hypothetical protein